MIAALVMASSVTAAADQQSGASVESARAQIQQQRYQYQLMEVLLESAVRQSAGETMTRAQMTLPLGTLFVGEPRAKGYPLDGYGPVFDVQIPIILESQVLLSQMAPVSPPPPPGPGTRPVSGTPTRATGVVPDDPTDRSPVVVDPFLRDPNAFYRNTVRDRLVDVILDESRRLSIAEGDWLSVVARSEDDPSRRIRDDSRTMILRIKGADLAAYVAGRITRDEAKKRVIESQF